MIKLNSPGSRALGFLFALLLSATTLSAQMPEYYYFQMNEGSGTTTADLAVPGLGGTASFNSGWSTGSILGAACLDGDSAPSTTSFLQTNAVNNISGDWTIEFWFYNTIFISGTNFIFGDSDMSNFRCFSGGFISSFNAQLDCNVPGFVPCQAMGATPQNTWTHTAFVYDDTAMTITAYVNGVAQTPVAQGTNLVISDAGANTTGMDIGGWNNARSVGRVDEFRFWSQARSSADINATMNIEIAASGLSDDLGCTAVEAPTNASSCSALSASEVVTFKVINFGTNTINIGDAFTADLVVNGTTIATENFTFLTNPLPTFATESFSFATTLDMSSGGIFNIDVTVNLAADVDPSNDTSSRVVDAGSLVDLAVASVDGPADATGCNYLTNAEVASFTVTNHGANTLPIGSAFNADLILDGTTIATEAFVITAADLLCGGSTSFTFAATLDLTAGGTRIVDVQVSLAGDVVPGNDLGSRSVSASGAGGGSFISSLPYLETFDTFGAAVGSATTPVNNGWVQDTADGSSGNHDWYFGVSTGSTPVGPETNGLGDHTSGSGRFGFVEDSSNSNPVVNLLSPCIDLGAPGLVNPQIRLYVHAHDFNGTGHFNPLHIDLITPGGVITSAASLLSDTGDNWAALNLSLTPYLGQVIQAQIRGTNTGSTSFYCDTSIDDFTIFEPVVLNGQAPQAGIATLDIDGALNVNNNDVASGDNGPFAATVNSGGTLTYTMSGEASAGILLVGGPLNPQVATFPGFGQFDIGTLPLDPNGIPGGLFMWADGVTAPLIGINQLFVLDGNGDKQVSFSLPNLPIGTLTTFQCIMTNSVIIAGFSNAVELSIL